MKRITNSRNVGATGRSPVLKVVAFRLLTFGFLTVLLVSSLFAQPAMDRKTLEQLVIKPEELRAALKPEDWRMSVPPEPLIREPQRAITAAANFQNINPDGTINVLMLVALYWFEDLERAKEYYKLELAEDPEPFKDLKLDELKVGAKDGADEARIFMDRAGKGPVLQLRKGQFVARFRAARLFPADAFDFPGEKLIKVAKSQLFILQCFLETGKRALFDKEKAKLVCPK